MGYPTDADKVIQLQQEEIEKLRERLRDQTNQTQITARQKHDAVVATIVRHLGGEPDYVDLQGHPIEQVVGTVLSKTLCERDEAREAARWFYINHCEGSDYDFEQHEKRWPWLEEDQ